MRSTITAMIAILAFAGWMSSFGNAGEQKKMIKPTLHIGGIISDDAKRKEAPKAGYLTTDDGVKKLWNVWGLAPEKMPKVNFKTQIVFVQLASGPNNIFTSYSLDKEGNLTPLSIQTLKAGPGFGYGVDVVEREGIKKYQGKPIE